MRQKRPEMTTVHISIKKEHLDFIKESEFAFSKLVRKMIQNLIDKQRGLHE